MKSIPSICVNKGKEYVFLYHSDIYYILSQGSYVDIYLTDQSKITLSKNLKQVEPLLDDVYFFRIHNSVIVNQQFVDKIHTAENQEVELVDGTRLPLSRRRKADFLKRFTKL